MSRRRRLPVKVSRIQKSPSSGATSVTGPRWTSLFLWNASMASPGASSWQEPTRLRSLIVMATPFQSRTLPYDQVLAHKVAPTCPEDDFSMTFRRHEDSACSCFLVPHQCALQFSRARLRGRRLGNPRWVCLAQPFYPAGRPSHDDQRRPLTGGGDSRGSCQVEAA